MRKLSLVVLLAMAVAACGGDPVVAEVDGHDIRESDVLALRDLPGSAVPAADFRNDLTRVILGQVVRTGLEDDFGVRVSQADVDHELEDQLASAGIGVDDAIAALQEPGATEQMLRANIEILLLRDEAYEALAAQPGLVEQVFADSPRALTRVCVSHVLVATSLEAEEVVGLLAAGTDFAALADEVSLDPSPGGDLGCLSPDAFVPEFADAVMVAPIGEVFGPVETDFGQHLILVSERTSPTLEEVKAAPFDYLPTDVVRSEWTLWLNERVLGADISIRSHIGSWSTTGQGIQPPG